MLRLQFGIHVRTGMLFVNRKLKDGVTCRNYGSPFPSKIQILFSFPRTSREIKTKLIRVYSNSLNQYSLPVHVNTHRQGATICNGFIIVVCQNFKARCTMPVELSNSYTVHSKRLQFCSRNTVVKYTSVVYQSAASTLEFYRVAPSYTDFQFLCNYTVIIRSPVAECLIPGAVVYKNNSYIMQFCYVLSIIRARFIRSADYPCTILSC